MLNVDIQNALELIMSKYRQHVTRLVNCPKPDFQGLNNRNIQVRSQFWSVVTIRHHCITSL